VKNAEEILIAKNFKNKQKTMVVGSCWPEDLEVLAPFINQNTMKFILAPHEISEHFLSSIEKMLEVKSIVIQQRRARHWRITRY
jgi:3-deoxy-D-manno-octulosonic-acid transferase